MTDRDVFALPTYEDARLPDAWPYILSFLSNRELVALSSVSTHFRKLAQGVLWSEPRRHWPTEDETIVDCFHRFLDSLDYSLRSTRQPYLYTQTLDLSDLGSDSLTFRFPRGWASKILAQLPNLRSFIVSGCDAFDNASIGNHLAPHPSIRLLSISACPNLTSKALTLLLKSATNLYYLEVSHCPRSRGLDVLKAISELSKLSTLKIRSSGYGDEDIKRLAIFIIGLRAELGHVLPQDLRCLDLRDNGLSDAVIESISRLGEALPSAEEPPPYDADELGDIESSQLIGSPPDGWSAFFEERLGREEKLGHYYDQVSRVAELVRDHDFKSPVENGVYGQGLTHLYVSGNQFSARGISTLLECLPLQKLDLGEMLQGESISKSDKIAGVPKQAASVHVILEALSKCPGLKTLRMNYRIVTGFSGTREHATSHSTDVLEDAPYPYSWLRLQGTQWDPAILRGGGIKMYQFSPALLALDTLSLTSVPKAVSSPELTDCLKAFIEAAGDMQRVSQLYEDRKLLDQRPQGPEESPKCALREMKLEVTTDRLVHVPQDQYDVDTEVYDEASQEDFSFFPDEKDAYVSTHRQRSTSNRDTNLSVNTSDQIGVVAELKAFRIHQREQLDRKGSSEKATGRVWNGKLAVIASSVS